MNFNFNELQMADLALRKRKSSYNSGKVCFSEICKVETLGVEQVCSHAKIGTFLMALFVPLLAQIALHVGAQ